MLVYFLTASTFIYKGDLQELGPEIHGKVINFENKKKKKCRICGYERNGIKYVEIQTVSWIDRKNNHKNVLFEYIVPSNVHSVIIGDHAISFHIPMY